MGHEWKPGDVALWQLPDGRTEVIYYHLRGDDFDIPEWRTAESGCGYPRPDKLRPALVIDPARLTWNGRTPTAQEFTEWAESLPAAEFATGVLVIADALRAIADPKPDEPQGLGAVVRDREGVLWVRDCPTDCPDGSGCIPWNSVKDGDRSKWGGVAAAEVLAAGWSE